MWQLSFAMDEKDARSLAAEHPEKILEEAIRRATPSFEPIADLLAATAASEVWAAPLCDRDPLPLRPKQHGTRVVVIGDASHPMSMFKGQGANQALQDAPLLVRWLVKPGISGLVTRLRCFENEVISRTAPKVLESREAAVDLHSRAPVATDYGVHGVPTERLDAFLAHLQSAGVGAQAFRAIDKKMRRVADAVVDGRVDGEDEASRKRRRNNA